MSQSPCQNLSEMPTVWALVHRAHGESPAEAHQAQEALLERYRQAIFRYLLGAVRDVDAAEELFQQFALRFVGGAFRRADPARGRFRQFLKSSLANLVADYRKRCRAGLNAARPLQPADEPAAPQEASRLEDEFLGTWRKNLLDQAWKALADRSAGGPPYYAVLRLTSVCPELSSDQIAERLTSGLNLAESLTAAGIRKILQRAREKFTDCLVEEVARSLGSTAPEAGAEELGDLGFMAYCRPAFARWASRAERCPG